MDFSTIESKVSLVRKLVRKKVTRIYWPTDSIDSFAGGFKARRQYRSPFTVKQIRHIDQYYRYLSSFDRLPKMIPMDRSHSKHAVSIAFRNTRPLSIAFQRKTCTWYRSIISIFLKLIVKGGGSLANMLPMDRFHSKRTVSIAFHSKTCSLYLSIKSIFVYGWSFGRELREYINRQAVSIASKEVSKQTDSIDRI